MLLTRLSFIMQARDVPWETYQTASLISDTDLSLIRRYDKRGLDLRVSMLVEAGPAHIQAFINCLKAVSKEETSQYVLALLLQLLQGKPHNTIHPQQTLTTTNPQRTP